MAESVRLILGDCVEKMAEIESGSVDAVVCDPPYPMISRPYGKMTEAEWHAMMDRLVPECRRVLKPTGSAVFVLQPNSERVGRMRPWLWEFMAKWTREWGMVQDAWWWNYGALPTEMANHQGGMRSSLKACVWLGIEKCYRDQESVLLPVADHHLQNKKYSRHDIEIRNGTPKTVRPSTLRGVDSASRRRGGSTPFNVIVSGNGGGGSNQGHGAQTPMAVADWWVRYISPPGGIVLDPFFGSGTMALAAIARGRSFIGIERDPGYFQIASRRIADAQSATPLLTG